jgi:hypothetical protein
MSQGAVPNAVGTAPTTPIETPPATGGHLTGLVAAPSPVSPDSIFHMIAPLVWTKGREHYLRLARDLRSGLGAHAIVTPSVALPGEIIVVRPEGESHRGAVPRAHGFEFTVEFTPEKRGTSSSRKATTLLGQVNSTVRSSGDWSAAKTALEAVGLTVVDVPAPDMETLTARSDQEIVRVAAEMEGVIRHSGGSSPTVQEGIGAFCRVAHASEAVRMGLLNYSGSISRTLGGAGTENAKDKAGWEAFIRACLPLVVRFMTAQQPEGVSYNPTRILGVDVRPLS